jgi:hypothetical protein
MGYLIVNLPVTIIIVVSAFLLSYVVTNFSFALIIGAVLGWIYWEYFIDKWIVWAIQRNVEHKRLHKIGLYSLLLWPKDINRIEKIATKLNSKN